MVPPNRHDDVLHNMTSNMIINLNHHHAIQTPWLPIDLSGPSSTASSHPSQSLSLCYTIRLNDHRHRQQAEKTTSRYLTTLFRPQHVTPPTAHSSPVIFDLTHRGTEGKFYQQHEEEIYN